MRRKIVWFMIGLLSLLIVMPVAEEQEEPGWLVKVILWIDEHLTGPQGGPEQGGEHGEDPPPSPGWSGGSSPDWND